jgi:hypothetical protein
MQVLAKSAKRCPQREMKEFVRNRNRGAVAIGVGRNGKIKPAKGLL